MRSVIVLPTYNERENIEILLRAVRSLDAPIDVLVVDDDSPDGTAEAARTLADELGGIDVLERSDKKGSVAHTEPDSAACSTQGTT